MPEARGTRPPVGQLGAIPGNQPSEPCESRLRTTSAPAVGQGRQMLKLKHCDGTESLDTFLHKFQTMATYLQWTEADIKYHVCGCLEGAAGQVLTDIAVDATSEDIIKLLKTRFGTELKKERFKAELHARRRHDNETLQHLYRDISRLVSVTRYSSCTSSFVEFNPKKTGNKTNNSITNRD